MSEIERLAKAVEKQADALASHTLDDGKQFEAVTDAIAGIAKDIGRMSETIHNMEANMDKGFKAMDAKMGPLLDAYNGVLFGKKLVTGVAAVIIAIAAIGGGIIWTINAAINKH